MRNLIIVDNESSGDGGALTVLTDSQPAVEKVIFVDNVTIGNGGAVYCSDNADVNFLECHFIENKAGNEFGAHGGAIYCTTNCDVRFTDCEFLTNIAYYGTTISGPAGGAGFFTNSCTAYFRDCLFDDNEAGAGGALCFVSSSGQIVRSTFTYNQATSTIVGYGGAIAYTGQSSMMIYNADFLGNSAYREGGAIYSERAENLFVMNGLFADNLCTENGGGVNLFGDENTTVTFINSTFADNHAGVYGGGLYADEFVPEESVLVENCIFWGNEHDSLISDQDIIDAQLMSVDSGVLSVKYSCIQDSSPASSTPFGGGSPNFNIDEDPEFVNAALLNYHLQDISPCIDFGSNGLIADDTLDVDGNPSNDGDDTPLDLALDPRKVDGNGTPGLILSCDGIVDMGAFEFQAGCDSCIFYGDLNYDSLIDGQDIQPFVDCFMDGTGGDSCGCQCGDYVGSNGVEIEDVAPFVNCLLSKGENCAEPMLCEDPPADPRSGLGDCNENEQTDETDIVTGYSEDCNGNGIPDECDIADETSEDIDEDIIPDECEPDCNDNDLPDDYDIDEETSTDCDSNGIPDECDFDCDGNEIPDACETADPDCNENGIIDACEWDCDESGVTDECELDGNDCNENGRLDSCDIDEGPPFGSLDTDENDIPDECEEEEMMMGGGSSCDATYLLEDYSVLSNELYAAWEEFTLWCMLEEWGPDSAYSGAEQLERLIEKKYEVGICEEELDE